MWVVYGPENGYDFPRPRLLRVEGIPVHANGTHYFKNKKCYLPHIKKHFPSANHLKIFDGFSADDLEYSLFWWPPWTGQG